MLSVKFHVNRHARKYRVIVFVISSLSSQRVVSVDNATDDPSSEGDSFGLPSF